MEERCTYCFVVCRLPPFPKSVTSFFYLLFSAPVCRNFALLEVHMEIRAGMAYNSSKLFRNNFSNRLLHLYQLLRVCSAMPIVLESVYSFFLRLFSFPLLFLTFLFFEFANKGCWGLLLSPLTSFV